MTKSVCSNLLSLEKTGIAITLTFKAPLDNSSQTLHNSSVWIYFLYTGYKCRVCEEIFYEYHQYRTYQ